MATYDQMLDRLQLLIDRDDADIQVAPRSEVNYDILRDCYDRAERRAYRSQVLMLPPFERQITYTVAPGTATLAIPNGYFAMRYACLLYTSPSPRDS